jgi:predicted O-linked N-acetylglucosamine transferase (SPINDLY family)
MPTISEALTMALAHHQAGRLQAAEQIYRRILQAEPNEADALHLLGVIAYQAGRHAAALDWIGRAIALKPQASGFYNNLGEVYRALDRLDEAAACYRRALELDPGMASAHNNLGNALLDQGRRDEALTHYRRAVDLDPRYADALNNLGNAWQQEGDFDAAEACYRRSLQVNPEFATALHNLGSLRRAQGRRDEAAACYRRALQLRPDRAETYDNLGAVLHELGQLDAAVACYREGLRHNPDSTDTYNDLGNALQDQGRFAEAVDCYRRGLEQRPDDANFHNNLGNALKALEKLDEADRSYRRALELQPDHAECSYNRGILLKEQGRLDEAQACYLRALELKSDYVDAQTNLSNVWKGQGKLEEALAGYRRALELAPDAPGPLSNILLCTQYQAGVTPARLAELHAEWDRRHAAPLRSTWQPHAVSRDPQRALRLGFVSADLSGHPVGYFLIRTLEALGREACQAVCYYNSWQGDDVTQRFRAASAVWREVLGLSDAALAEQIRADGIDVLFDLAGHTAGTRILMFARKPAPIQITWIGYEGTTGLAAMDAIIADRHMIPPAAAGDYREEVLRMPDGYVCYDPPRGAAAVGPLPALAQGWVTFGSFSNPAKITPEVVALWASILNRVPRSRLVLKYRGLDDCGTGRRYAAMFAEQGIDRCRLDLRGASAFGAMLAEYGQVDVALDPFPFSGSATTCEALWMGVPVVTCPGETFASRHSLSHLSNIGFTETIARDRQEYVELAVGLARDLPRLAAIRAGLRQRMAASPLCDGPRFAGNLMALLRSRWQKWVAAEG